MTGKKIKLPKIAGTTESWTKNEDDFSIDKDNQFSLTLPSATIYKAMGLKTTKEDAVFAIDKKIVAYDPSVTETGQSVLLIKKEYLKKFLKQSKFSLCWVVIGEKLMVGGSRDFKDGALRFTGCVILNSKGKILKHLKSEYKKYN
jgi:hypothetical protein